MWRSIINVQRKPATKGTVLKILHTSDWHLGRTLYGRKRYLEFEAFLDWLAQTIEQHQIEVLLVAGDVFDTNAPSNRAQSLYYKFLCRIANSACRHVVVIAGNHDSPSFLNAPKELLKALNVHVLGAVGEHVEDEVLLLRQADGIPELLVCAVPYLRDRDIRVADAGESLEDKDQKIRQGIRDHYAQVAAEAERQRGELAVQVPIIGMGHLFTAGGQTVEGDGVRELYVGSLAHVKADIFPDCFDYLALGHLHVPQKVGGSEVKRYCGSPIAMGFGEAKQEKSVCLVDLPSITAPNQNSGDETALRETKVQLEAVPCFQKLERIRGDWSDLEERLKELCETQPQAWLEVIYDGDEVIGDLRERLEAVIAHTEIEILRVKNLRVFDQVLGQMHQEETLDDLNVNEVFERCLVQNQVPEQQRPELMQAYQEVLESIFEEDTRKE